MCALETAALELATNGETGGGGHVTPEAIEKSIDSLEDELQKVINLEKKMLIMGPFFPGFHPQVFAP